jgi:hypothetical protein
LGEGIGKKGTIPSELILFHVFPRGAISKETFDIAIWTEYCKSSHWLFQANEIARFLPEKKCFQRLEKR